MTKTLKISENTHTKLKTHCSKNKLKLNEWVEELLLINMIHPVLIEYLTSFEDIEHMRDKLKTSSDPIEIEKLKKQLYLVGENRVVIIEAFLKKVREENGKLTTK
jgi:hypothetical protein